MNTFRCLSKMQFARDSQNVFQFSEGRKGTHGITSKGMEWSFEDSGSWLTDNTVPYLREALSKRVLGKAGEMIFRKIGTLRFAAKSCHWPANFDVPPRLSLNCNRAST